MTTIASSGRKLIVTEFLTLDGVMEAPEKWSFKYWSDAVGKFKRDELFATGSLLLGAKTYETFAGAWPTRQDKEGFADRMNSLPKYVVSESLKEVAWTNSRLIKGNVAEEIAKLKREPGQDIVVHGSRTLVQFLMKHGLVDRLHLLVFPVLRGGGARLFDEGTQATLDLIEVKAFDTGVTALIYQPSETLS
jgi:dihydrofolate reductase